MTEDEKEYIAIAKKFGSLNFITEDANDEYLILLGKGIVDHLAHDLYKLPVAEKDN